MAGVVYAHAGRDLANGIAGGAQELFGFIDPGLDEKWTPNRRALPLSTSM